MSASPAFVIVQYLVTASADDTHCFASSVTLENSPERCFSLQDYSARTSGGACLVVGHPWTTENR